MTLTAIGYHIDLNRLYTIMMRSDDDDDNNDDVDDGDDNTIRKGFNVYIQSKLL